MNKTMALLQMISIIILTFLEYKKGSPIVFLWATLFVMIGFPHFLSVWSSELEYSSKTYFIASSFMFVFNVIYYITRRFLYDRYIKVDILDIRCGIKDDFDDILKYLIIFTSLYIFISLVKLKIDYGSLRNVTWGKMYENGLSLYDISFNTDSLLYFTKYFVLGTGGILFLGKEKNKFWTSILFFLTFLYAVVTKNRILILPILTTIIVGIMQKHREINLKLIILLSFVGFLGVYFIYALRLFRHYGTWYEFKNSFSFVKFNRELVYMFLNGDGELGLRNVFLYFIENNNNFPGFNKGHTYLRLILILIPTSYSFGLKPNDFAITMGSAWLGDFTNTSYSTHPTLYGDVYANFALYGVLLAIFWALFTTVLDYVILLFKNKKRLIPSMITYLLNATGYIIIARGSVYNGILFNLLSWFLYMLMYLTLVKFIEFKNNKSKEYI